MPAFAVVLTAECFDRALSVPTQFSYALAQIGCQLLSRSPVVHFDGPQSVRAAFTETEAKKLAAEAGMKSCTTRRHWPERYLLRWDA